MIACFSKLFNVIVPGIVPGTELRIRTYVPGYEIILGPIMEDDTVTTMMQVAGLGDYLPVYSGNLDIINSAAINIAEAYAKKLMGGEQIV